MMKLNIALKRYIHLRPRPKSKLMAMAVSMIRVLHAKKSGLSDIVLTQKLNHGVSQAGWRRRRPE